MLIITETEKPKILAVRRQRQEDLKLEADLGYRVSSRPAWISISRLSQTT
jgi:hypothetical protein